MPNTAPKKRKKSTAKKVVSAKKKRTTQRTVAHKTNTVLTVSQEVLAVFVVACILYFGYVVLQVF